MPLEQAVLEEEQVCGLTFEAHHVTLKGHCKVSKSCRREVDVLVWNLKESSGLKIEIWEASDFKSNGNLGLCMGSPREIMYNGRR